MAKRKQKAKRKSSKLTGWIAAGIIIAAIAAAGRGGSSKQTATPPQSNLATSPPTAEWY